MNDYSNYFFVLNCHTGERDKLHSYSTFKELEVRDIIDNEGVVMKVLPPTLGLAAMENSYCKSKNYK